MGTEIAGRSKGGIARAAALPADRKREIARKAARARWGTEPLVATHGSTDHPLRIGSVEIPCYVLQDGTRVLSQRGLQNGIGLSEGGGQGGARKIAALMDRLASKGINIRNLSARVNSPILFVPPHGGNAADGYDAAILPDICAVLIEAQQKDKLDKRLVRLAERAAMLQHGFATVGIIALVDEATGYQSVRPQDALQAYLEKVLSKELAAWVKRFPDEFYENIYKLKGWRWPGMGKNRYSIVGTYTRDLVYDRLGPGITRELESRSPKGETGARKNKMHQWLSEDIGHPMLAQHIHSLIMFQRLAIASGYGWNRFTKMVDQVFPRKGDTLELPLNDPDAT